MKPEELVGFLYTDLVGMLRGRFVAAGEAGERMTEGLGWVPANQALTSFGTLAEPNAFGSTGDLRIVPDADTHVRLEGLGDRETLDFYLCDAVEPDGTPWDCCPRTWAANVLEELEAETGAKVRAAFEHEFLLESSAAGAPPFSLEAMRKAAPFPGLAMAALKQAGVEPETILAEYGENQFEIPCRPQLGLAAADRSVVLKEIVREVARTTGRRATFAPVPVPDGSTNGVHVHLSLVGAGGEELTHGDLPGGLSSLAGSFAAGILRHAPAIAALVAATPLSYQRFQPHHWAAGTAALGAGNRETLLRIPASPSLAGGNAARHRRLEFRGADATASPYVVLGAIVSAGLEGIRRRLPSPPLLDRDPDRLSAREKDDYAPHALPGSLAEALDLLERDMVVSDWFPPRLLETYLTVKRAELSSLDGFREEEVCHHYRDVY